MHMSLRLYGVLDSKIVEWPQQYKIVDSDYVRVGVVDLMYKVIEWA